MADITGVKANVPGGKVTWSNVTSADTPLEAAYFGGAAVLTVSGVFGGASIQWEWGADAGITAAMNTDEHPAGAKFTSAGSCVTYPLSEGFIKPVRTGGDGTTALKLTVTFVRT